MAEKNPGFGETNTPERAGGIVRDHVRAVIESAEGNAAEIRRRAREDADALDQERADSASRLTTHIGELEGSFTSFGERLGQEVLPSGEIQGELGSGGEERSATGGAVGGEAATRSATAWRSPETTEPDAVGEADEAEDDAPEEGEGLLGGLRKRFSPPAEDPPADVDAAEEHASEQTTGEADALDDSTAAAPPPDADTATSAPSQWVPEGVEAGQGGEGPDAAAAGGEAASWAPPSEPEPEPEAAPESEADPEMEDPAGESWPEETPEAAPETASAEAPDSAPSPSQPPPRGRIARLLLGRRPGE